MSTRNASVKSVTLLALAVCTLAGNALAAEPSARAAFSDERVEYSLNAIQRLSEDELKEFYVRCSRAAVRGRLGHGEIALCSTAYERLLKEIFRGDFRALLEWRRSLRRPPPAGT